MADESTVLDTVRRYFEFVGADIEHAEEIYHDDAILEFPQSGERFEGVATFTECRRQYPADSAQVRFRIRRVSTWPLWSCRQATTALRGCRVSSCWSFVGTRWRASGSMSWDAWEAPEWRAPWRADTPADPPEESFSQRSDHEPGLELGGEER